jgi:hypothetical protein
VVIAKNPAKGQCLGNGIPVGVILTGYPLNNYLEVTPQLAAHRLPEVGECACVALLAEPVIDLHQGAAQALFRRLALQSRFACPTSAPAVREAEIVEGGQPRPVSKGPPGLPLRKGEQAGLLGIEVQAEFPRFPWI